MPWVQPLKKKKDFYFVCYTWFTMLCQFLLYSKVTLSYIYVHILFLTLSSIMFHHKWLDLVPCATQQDPWPKNFHMGAAIKKKKKKGRKRKRLHTQKKRHVGNSLVRLGTFPWPGFSSWCGNWNPTASCCMLWPQIFFLIFRFEKRKGR